MTERAFRPGFWASFFSLVTFCVLIGLGVWQLQRLEWKQGLIDRLEARATAEPMTVLPSALPSAPLDLEALSYRSVRLEGAYVPGADFVFPGRSYQGATGRELASAFLTKDGRGVIVSRGWLPPERGGRPNLPPPPAGDSVTIEGIFRPGGWSGMESFRPVNDPQSNRWLFYDLEAMTAQAGLEDPMTELYVSLKVEDGDETPPIPLPPAVTLANNHLEYALTWFALAGGLMAIYLLFGFSRGRDS